MTTSPHGPAAPPLAVDPPPLPSAPVPAFAAARTSSVGTLLRETMAVWWKNIFKFGGLTLMVVVPFATLALVGYYQVFAAVERGAVQRGAHVASPTVRLLGAFAILVPTMLVLSAIQMGAVAYGTVQHLAGRRARFGAMLAAGFRRFFPAVAACLLCGLLIVGGTFFLVVPGIVLACAMAVALPAVVLEGIGPIAAIQRSWDLTRDHRLRIFGAWLAVFTIATGLNTAARLVATLLVATLLGTLAPIAVLAWLPIYLLVLPLPAILPAVVYHALRAEKEGVAPTADLAHIFE